MYAHQAAVVEGGGDQDEEAQRHAAGVSSHSWFSGHLVFVLLETDPGLLELESDRAASGLLSIDSLNLGSLRGTQRLDVRCPPVSPLARRNPWGLLESNVRSKCSRHSSPGFVCEPVNMGQKSGQLQQTLIFLFCLFFFPWESETIFPNSLWVT